MEFPGKTSYKDGMRSCRGSRWGAAALAFLLQSGTSDVLLFLPKAKEVAVFQRRLEAGEILRIEKSLGGKFPEAGKVLDLFTTNAPPPEGSQPQDLLVLFLPLERMKGAELALAANAKGEVAAVGVISGHSVDKSWSPFLAQFVGPSGLQLTSNSENHPSVLADLQKKAVPNGNDEGKRLHALLSQKQFMWENGIRNERLYDQVRAKSDKAAASAKEYAKFLGQVVDFSPRMGALLEPGELKTYQEHLKEIKKASEQLGAQAAKNDWDGANKSLRSIQNRCGKCHGWDGSHYQKPLEGAMIELRESLGIGKGYFVVGHDVQSPQVGKKDEAQTIATTVKKGLWILKFSFANR